MIGASVGVASNTSNVQAGHQFEDSTKKVATTLSDLIKVTGALNPGVKECEVTIDEIEKAISRLDAATFDAASGKLSREGPFQQYQADASELAKKVSQDIQNLFNSAGGTSSQLKAAAVALKESVPALASRIEDTASTAPELGLQTKLLTTTKQVADNVIKLIKDSQNINLSDKDAVTKLIALSSAAQEDVGVLLDELSTGADLPQELDRECKAITIALQSLAVGVPSAANYSECKEQLAAATKDAVKAVTHFYSVDKRQVGQVSLAAARVGEVVTKLVQCARTSAATTKERMASSFWLFVVVLVCLSSLFFVFMPCPFLTRVVEAKKGLLEGTKVLGVQVVHLLQDVKATVQGQDVQAKFASDFQTFNQATSNLLTASKKGAVGEMLIEQAIKGINAQITNLNAAGIFAQAGQLEEKKMSQQMTMGDFQHQIASDCGKLQECARTIARTAQSISGSDEDLGNAAIQLEKIIAPVAQMTIAGASKLQDSRSQQSLLSAAKLLGISSHQFILSANDVQRIRDDSTAKQTLATSLTSVIDHCSNLGTPCFSFIIISLSFDLLRILTSSCCDERSGGG
jgi:hypothetical protein